MRFVLSAMLVLLGVWFWIDNLATLSQHVAIRLRLPFVELAPLPPGPRIDLLLALAFVLGFALAWSLTAWRRFRAALEIRRLRKKVRDLERQAPAAPQPVPAPASSPQQPAAPAASSESLASATDGDPS